MGFDCGRKFENRMKNFRGVHDGILLYTPFSTAQRIDRGGNEDMGEGPYRQTRKKHDHLPQTNWVYILRYILRF